MMRIAIDVSPLSSGHKVRGTGFYLTHLKKSLLQYFPEFEYTFFTQTQDIDRAVNLIHYPYFEPFFLTLPLRKKIPTVITIHDLMPIKFPSHFPSGIKGTLKWNLNRLLLKKVDAIITDSESSKKDIMQFIALPEEKINVVYLAAGEEFKKISLSQEERNNLQKKYSLPEKFVLYVGDVTWNKNLPRLIRAIQQAKLPFIMVGKAFTTEIIDTKNKWNEDIIFVQKELKSSGSVKAIGFVPTDDLVKLYNMATVFVMPSLYEGFGLPVIEAMSCGCPVVTTHEGSLREVVGDACIIVDGYNVEDIKNGIERVFSSEKLQKELSDKGLRQAKKFSWKKTAQETAKIYEKIY